MYMTVNVPIAITKTFTNAPGFCVYCIIGITTPMPSNEYTANPTVGSKPLGLT
jgi:hypothetical protein